MHSGLRAVIAESDDDVVVVMDADDTRRSARAGAVPALARGADLAIASMFVEGGDEPTAPFFRRLLSRGAAVLFRAAIPLDGARDFTSGYRAYRVSLLRRTRPVRRAAHRGARLGPHRGAR